MGNLMNSMSGLTSAMGMNESQGGDVFSKSFEGTWFLLGIPGAAIFLSALAVIVNELRKCYLVRRVLKKTDPCSTGVLVLSTQQERI